jgi:glycosyltransferase involved in cell wall biosynthesis
MENFRLLTKCFPELDQTMIEQVYDLKFYKHWHGFKRGDQALTDLLKQTSEHSGEFRISLLQTVRARKMPPLNARLPAVLPGSSKQNVAIALSDLIGVSGGAERIAIETANALFHNGHRVTFVCCHGLAGEPFYALDPQIPLIDLNTDPYGWYYRDLGADLRLDFDALTQQDFPLLDYQPTTEDFLAWCKSGHLRRTQAYHGFFREHHFDVVISHMPSTFPYVLLARPKDDQALHIACLHSSPVFKFYSDEYPNSGKFDQYIRLASLERADRISILFETYRAQMPPPYRAKCFELPNFTRTLPAESRTPAQSRTILSVGRLIATKRHDTLIKSYAKIRHLYPEWRLRIVGEGPLRDELSALCEELGMAADEVLAGTTDDMEGCYADAGIYAFPSAFEGFGLTLVEAMANGLPVVAFEDCEGPRALIEDGRNGLLVGRRDEIGSLSAALERLIESPDERARLGKAAQQTARRYALDRSIGILEDVMSAAGNFNAAPRRPAPQPDHDFSAVVVATDFKGGAGIAARRLVEALAAHGVETCGLGLSEPIVHRKKTAIRRLKALFRSGNAHGSRRSPITPDGRYFQVGPEGQHAPYTDLLGRIASTDNTQPGATTYSPGYPGLPIEQLRFLSFFDVINLHWVASFLSPEAVAFLAGLGKPLVWTLHDMNPFTGGCHYSSGCEGYAKDCANCPQLIDTFNDFPARVLSVKRRYWPDSITVVTPSRWLADCAARSSLWSNHRIEVIPNGVNTDLFRPLPKAAARQRLGLPADSKIVLFTCQLHAERRKGYRELLEVARILADRRRDLHVLTLGRASAGAEEIPLPHTSLGHVEREELMALAYSASDATILPTLEDNLPNVILESIACGTPVAAFDSGGVKDAVLDGITGYTAPPGDCRGLSAAVERLLAEDLSTSCRGEAIRRFSLTLQADRYAQLFETLLDERPGTTGRAAPPVIYPEIAKSLAPPEKGLSRLLRNIGIVGH